MTFEPKWMHYGTSMEAIHADWPTYPRGHGEEVTLKALCMFPIGATLLEVSDIDRCSLLLPGAKLPEDPFDSKHLHAAVWHEELIALAEAGLVDGVRGENEYQAALAQHAILEDLVARGAAIKKADGTFEPVKIRDRPTREEYIDPEMEDEEAPKTHALISATGLSVTAKGWAHLEKIATAQVHPLFSARVVPLLALEQFDTAIREASVILETELRKRFGAGQGFVYGERLMKAVANGLTTRDGGSTAFNLGLRAELRTLFAFVRNEFAHNLVSISRARCHVLLERFSGIATDLQHYDSSKRA